MKVPSNTCVIHKLFTIDELITEKHEEVSLVRLRVCDLIFQQIKPHLPL